MDDVISRVERCTFPLSYVILQRESYIILVKYYCGRIVLFIIFMSNIMEMLYCFTFWGLLIVIIIYTSSQCLCIIMGIYT